MTPEIEPAGIREYGDLTVMKYNLPEDVEIEEVDHPLLMLDVSEQGYTAEWFTEIDVGKFRDVLEKHASLNCEGEATFNPGCKSNFRSGIDETRTVQEILDENANYFPRECSHLKLKEDTYQISWEEIHLQRSITLNVDSNDTAPLEVYYTETFEHENLPREHVGDGYVANLLDITIEQAGEIINDES